MRDLAKLSVPFPREFIQRDPGGNAYVAHENVNQWLLGIVGPFDFELVQVIKGDVAGTDPDPGGKSPRARAGTPTLTGVVVGGVWRLHCEIDGRATVIEEVGDVEDPHNWRHDGARLKQTASDAIKRCAMRLGLGLHLWAGERYVLAERLNVHADQDQPERFVNRHGRLKTPAPAAGGPPTAAGAGITDAQREEVTP